MRGTNAGVDAAGLRERLAATVDGEIGFDAGTRALYTADASIYRRVPVGVVLPRSVDGVIAAVAAAREFDAPLVVRGGGTSVAGQATGTGLVIDTSRYLTRIDAIDPTRCTATVQPGVVLDRLNQAAAVHDLTFGPDPATRTRCTVGGMIGNNSCGAHSVAWGTTADNVEALDVLTYRGERHSVGSAAGHPAVTALLDRYRAALRTGLPQLPRRSSGYLLDRLLPERGGSLAAALVGAEGSCVTVLGATVRLVPAPAARALLVLGYPDAAAAADAAPAVAEYRPLAVEGIDEQLVATLATRGRRPPVALPAGGGWLYVEVGGESPDDAAAVAARVARAMAAPSQSVVTDPDRQRALWRIREHGAGLASRMPDGSEAWPGWEDAAVPPERLGGYLRDFTALLAAHHRRGIMYGHFGEGCVHVRIDFDLGSAAGVAGYRRFLTEAADLVIGYGGVFSGEHGDGLARTELYERLFPAEVIRAFGEFKAIWDPDDRMNPGVAVRPLPLDRNLRLTAGPRPRTQLGYPEDGGDFARALRRCVGVAACRTERGGVMCPSFRATRAEQHSTRGRARLLEEMLGGELITDGWRSAEVRDALDLCLSCKGCASDCPVNVDMAAYKSEFLAHHYAGRPRPASHYSLGCLPLWLRLARLAPSLVNGLMGGRTTGSLLRWLAGIAAERPLPPLPARSLLGWYHRRPPARNGGDQVLLWPDTFTNYLTPSVGIAAVGVLESAGLSVRLPDRAVCCGLTWLSTGQLGVARRVMRRALDVLAPVVAAGTPVVVLEPSCAAALRGDLAAVLPGDPRAGPVAAGIRTFAELLHEHAPQWTPPAVDADAIVQIHCHQHAVLGFDPDRRLLGRAGVRADVPDAGCCGLAGNFGFERGHYPVSMAVGELALLPAVRAAGPDTLVIADGISCRLQIAHGTGRPAYHLAEVLAKAATATPTRPS
ncbi:MAG TPA: FAD-binding and (Fe-S)-binding domain-containing protein [Actinomycetes bacterium]|nr:FAD-binding and (Fe-S)-binding domain-containing protein [Actinomycetes bacterium]